MKSFRLLLLPLALSMASAANALEFKSVGAEPAILYDAPTSKGRKLFVAPRGMPVEVVLTYGGWIKVRDAAGDLAWIEAKSLTSRRNLVVTTPGARVRTMADESAPVAFTADKGVLLELSDATAGGWVKVKHGDGTSGYIRATDVWGE